MRYSLSANAKHGRRRDEGTLKRAYELAIKYELVEETDMDGCRRRLPLRRPTAQELTQSARDADLAYRRSLVVLLESKGRSQRQIVRSLARAGYGRVPQQTVARLADRIP